MGRDPVELDGGGPTHDHEILLVESLLRQHHVDGRGVTHIEQGVLHHDIVVLHQKAVLDLE